MAKRWSRTTRGANMQVFVSKPINYTVLATYALFVAGAAVGEIGVFNDDATNTLRTTLLTSGNRFFVAQKVSVPDGVNSVTGIKRSGTYAFGDITPRHKVYVAPVRSFNYLGWNGTQGGFNLAVTPSINLSYEFAVIETTEGNDPFPTWNYITTFKPTWTQVEIAQDLARQVNDPLNPVYKSNNRLVKAEVLSNGTLSNFTMTGTTPTMTFTNGSAVVTLGGTTPTFNGAVGQYIASVDGNVTIDNTNHNLYRIVAISAGVSITLDRIFEGPTRVLAQAQAQGTAAAGGSIKLQGTVTNIGLKLIDLNDDETFRLAVRDQLENADITLGGFTMGNGTPRVIRQLEIEGQEWQGGTTKSTPQDIYFGFQDTFVSITDTYDTYNLTYQVRANLIGPTEAFQTGQIAIACAKSAGNLIANFTTIFGV